MIIEAKPAGLERLVLPPAQAGWRFQGEIPSKHQVSTGRRWFIREQTQVITNIIREQTPEVREADTDAPESLKLPPGACLWHPTDAGRRLLVLAKHDARELLDRQTLSETASRLDLPADDEWRAHGRLTLFATPGPAELCLGDSMRLLHPVAPYLARLVQEYGRTLGWMYGLGHEELEESCRLHIAWFGPMSASAMRLQAASPCRYENGPIVRVGIGRPVVTHDMAPVLEDPCDGNEPAVRLGVPEGVMLCTDGASRMRFSHGHPRIWSDTGESSAWFTLTFFLDCTRQSVAVGYDRMTREVIMATPVRRDRVVASSQPSVVPAASGLGLDLMGVLVKDMRRRLRVAESHLLVSRHEVDRKSSSSPSSSISLERSST